MKKLVLILDIILLLLFIIHTVCLVYALLTNAAWPTIGLAIVGIFSSVVGLTVQVPELE